MSHLDQCPFCCQEVASLPGDDFLHQLREAHGLSDSWRGDDVTAAHLPMHGAADSLNVSTTAAVLLYEATRQRGLQERSI